MAGVLTLNLVYQKAKTDEVDRIRKLNVCGSSLQDVGVLRHVKNLEVLSLSVNEIEELSALSELPVLTELYLRRNLIRDMNEVLHLSRLRNLHSLNLSDNPICRDPNYRRFVIAAIPSLRVLDDSEVRAEERRAAQNVFPDLAQFAPPASGYYSEFGQTNDDSGYASRGAPPPPQQRTAGPSSSRPPSSSGRASSCGHAHHDDPYSRPPSRGAGRPPTALPRYPPPPPPPPPASAGAGSGRGGDYSSASTADRYRPVTASSAVSSAGSSLGPSEAAVVQAIKVLASELSPSGSREVQRFLQSMQS